MCTEQASLVFSQDLTASNVLTGRRAASGFVATDGGGIGLGGACKPAPGRVSDLPKALAGAVLRWLVEVGRDKVGRWRPPAVGTRPATVSGRLGGGAASNSASSSEPSQAMTSAVAPGAA